MHLLAGLQSPRGCCRHAEDWTPIVVVASSLLEKPLQLHSKSDAAVREAIQVAHDGIFKGWPPTDGEIEDFIKSQI
jgi:hypothetical protein